MPDDLPPTTGHGAKDRERYKQKIENRLRQGVKDVITGENVITAPDGQKVRIKVQDIHEPRFRRPQPKNPGGVGAGDGGDPIVTVPIDGEDGRGGAGEEHDEGYVYVDVPLSEVAAWVFAELALPALKPKRGAEDDTQDSLTARGRRGVVLDKRKTLLQHKLREVASGKEEPWSENDLIYRRWHEQRKPSVQAAIVLVRDASGSITRDMQYTIRVAYFWIVQWLRQAYPVVKVRFVLHDTEAIEVSEEDFFKGRTMGGTAISSGLALAEKILDDEYPAESWNRYLVAASDGENWEHDNKALESAISRISPKVELLAYGQLAAGQSVCLDMMRAAQSPSVRAGYVTSPQMIGTWLRTIFGGEAA